MKNKRPLGLRKTTRRSAERRGVAAVEFAFVAPLLVALLMGVVEVNRTYEAQNLLETAAREGARFASMDRDGMVEEGQTSNEKMIHDMKTFLESNGVPRDSINVEVKHFDQPELDFDIDDPDNDLALFEVRVEIDYSDISYTAVDTGSDYALSASVVFRNGRATISD